MNFLLVNFVVVLWITAITTFLLGVFVWLRRRHSHINRTFALYCFSISWWSFCEIWGIAADAKETALFWTRLEQVGVFFIPTFFVHFIISLLNIKDKKWLIKSAYCFSVITALFCFTPFMMADSVPISAAPYVKRFGAPGLVYHFAILFFVILIVFGLRELYIAYRKSSGSRKNQLKYLFFSTLFGYIGGGANFLLVYNISIPVLNPFGTYALPIYIAVVTYAIVKYRLMDIRIAAIRTIVFVIVYIPVLLTPFLVGLLLRSSLEKILGQNWWIAPTLGSSILAPLGIYVYMVIKTRAEDILLREQRKYQHTLLHVSQGMTLIKELDKLLRLIVHIVSRALKIKDISLFLFDKDKQRYVLSAIRYKDRIPEGFYFEEDEALVKQLRLHKRPIVLEEIQTHLQADGRRSDGDLEAIERRMKEMKMSVIVPSFVQETLLGFLVLGEKAGRQMYTQDDLNVFEVLANQAALAIENAVFYQEQGKTLAEKFHEHKVWSIGKMGAGVGHQINNCFNNVRSAVEVTLFVHLAKIKQVLVQNGLQSLGGSVDKAEECLNAAVADSKRGGEIATTLTNFSRKSTDFKPVIVDEIVKGALNLLSCKFHVQDLNLVCEIPPDIPKVFGILSILQSIFMNMFDNAHDAHLDKKEKIDQGGLVSNETFLPKIFVRTRKDATSNFLIIEIEDNGIGMTEEQQKQLYIPFFTTKATSEKGTGLGLSIIKQMIDLHKGTIKLNSKYGEGTTITLALPIAKE